MEFLWIFLPQKWWDSPQKAINYHLGMIIFSPHLWSLESLGMVFEIDRYLEVLSAASLAWKPRRFATGKILSNP
jgi:lauroyl/myristoyl acyltransferase